MHQLIRQMIELGYLPIPMQKNKIPATKWGQYRNKDPAPEVLERWFENRLDCAIVLRNKDALAEAVERQRRKDALLLDRTVESAVEYSLCRERERWRGRVEDRSPS